MSRKKEVLLEAEYEVLPYYGEYVYVAFDELSRCLYVGMTRGNPFSRLGSHASFGKKYSHWMRVARKIKVFEKPSKFRTLEEFEQDMILAYNPSDNVVGI